MNVFQQSIDEYLRFEQSGPVQKDSQTQVAVSRS